MAEITAALVKELREKSGAGMMDCKKALAENDGSVEDAMNWLRKKGLSAAAKKSGRATTEGLVSIAVSDNAGAIVELNAETDFVARNDKFQDFARKVAELSLTKGKGDIEALKGEEFEGGKTVGDALTDLIATIGENMNLRRVARVTNDNGVIVSYVHNAMADNLGKIGVLVSLESDGDKAKLEELGKQIAMHVAAARPEALSRDDVSAEKLESEKDILRDQALASGKPAEIVEKMVEGRMRKYYEEICLLEQIFVVDGERTVGKVVEDAAKDVGAPVKLAGFIRFELGEGLDKKDEDFAAEVAATLAG